MASIPSQQSMISTSPCLGFCESSSRPADRIHPLVRLLPSLTDVVFLLPLLLLFGGMRGAYSLLGDGDTGWHVRTGQWILAHHQVPLTDMFSYTRPGRPWFAWEWLWDVIFAWFYQHGGLAAVVLASLLVILLTLVMLFRLVRRKCGNLLVAFAVTTIVMAGSTIHWLARPHLVTLLFTVIFYSILERVREADLGGARSRRRLLFLLPPLTVLWTNLHGGFPVGIILLGAYAAGEMTGYLLAPEAAARRARLRACSQYALTSTACLLASLVNPYFYRLHVHIFQYLGDSYAFDHISEFQSISFHYWPSFFLEAMVLLGAVAAFWSIRRKQYVYAFLILGWTHPALMSARNIPILLLVAAPPVGWMLVELLAAARQSACAGWLRRAVERFEALAADMDQTDRIGRLHLVSAVAFLLVAALFYAPAPPEKFRAQYDPKAYPQKALQFLGGPGIPDRIFTHDEWGDYLLYSLYPTKVFVDGRSDFYGGPFCLKYLDVMGVKYDWEQTLARYHVKTILLPADAPLSGALKESTRWRLVYDDGLAIVFRAAGGLEQPDEQVSSARASSGKGRDREITKQVDRDRTITKSTT